MLSNTITKPTPFLFTYHTRDNCIRLSGVTLLKYTLYADYIYSFFRAIANISYGVPNWWYELNIKDEIITKYREDKLDLVARKNNINVVDVSKLASLLGIQNIFTLFYFIETECNTKGNLIKMAEFIQSKKYKLAI